MNRVKDKVAIVTGGALGLGQASAILLAREGATVVITDIKDEEGNEAAQEINKEGGKAVYIHQDVALESEWKSVIDKTIHQFGKLDILVNNAGVGVGGPLEELTLKEWR